MKSTKLSVAMAAAVVLYGAVSLWADTCTDAKKRIDEAVALPPNLDTDKNLQSALKECPYNPAFYHLIGDYYNNWWKRDINPERQAQYNYLATEYYAKGIKMSKGKDNDTMRRKLAVLESGTQAITEVGIRSIRPGARLNIRVFFEFNSADLSKDAQDELDILGRYLGDAKSSRIVLEGHTDMVGGEEFNMALSKHRAESAKAYLIKKFRVTPEGIETQGYGFERLADVDDPYSAKNRRVRVRKLPN
jgi:outer membrane protein OmpA-like peptidoglycan-associated protein